MRKTTVVVVTLLVIGSFVSLQGQQIETNAAATEPVTVVTITQANGEVFTFSDRGPQMEGMITGGNELCEGLWTGNNDVRFNLINQTTIDTFRIIYRNVGGCTTVEVKSSPVNVSGNSFSISYNIPTISSGSLSGMFSEDGQSVSGSFSYSNNQCGGGSVTGAWNAAPVTPCIQILDPPLNLTAALIAEGVQLDWQAPGSPSPGDTTEIAYDDGSAEIGIRGNFDGAELAMRFTPPSYPVNLISFVFGASGDVAPDDYGVRVYLDPAAMNVGPVNAPVFDGIVTFNQAGLIQADFPTPISVESGDFYIALFFVPGETGDFAIDRDTNSTDALRSWLRNPSTGAFVRSGDLGFPGNFIIRAIVTSNVATAALASSNFGGEKKSAVMKERNLSEVTVSGSHEFSGSYHDYANSQRLYSLSKTAALQGFNIYRSETSPVTAESQNLIGSVEANILSFIDDNAAAGATYFYAVSAQYNEGESGLSNEVTVIVTAVTGQSPNLPDGFRLQQNFPNPFNPSTLIRYELPAGRHVVHLEVFNTLGEKIRTLVHEQQSAGSHQVQWDGRDDAGRQLASGIYVYRLQAGSFFQVRKMLLIR
jgi:hypothetical protein